MPHSLCNYHTHTWRCKHATGTETEYLENAIAAGYQALGFTDHMAWPYPNGFVSPIRMDASQLREYADTIHRLQERYAGKIRVYLGAECEYYPDYLPWLQEQKTALSMDYLILGVHYPPIEAGHHAFAEAVTPEELKHYTKLCIEGMETGIFAYLCHPDLPLKSYPRFDLEAQRMSEKICEAAVRLDIPLEYNLAGVKLRGAVPTGFGYTSDEFWRIAAAKGCRAVIAMDAHEPVAMSDSAFVLACRKKLEQMGVCVLDRLPGLK